MDEILQETEDWLFDVAVNNATKRRSSSKWLVADVFGVECYLEVRYSGDDLEIIKTWA